MSEPAAQPPNSSLFEKALLYCPACEQSFAPSPSGRMPLLLSPCGHSLCGDCFSVLPPPTQCILCHSSVESHSTNTPLAELASDVLQPGEEGGDGAPSPSAAAVLVSSGGACPECAAFADHDDEDDEACHTKYVCVTCNKALCGDHARVHAKRKRPHSVVDVGGAPDFPSAAKKPARLTFCPKHPEFVMDSFCLAHRAVLCKLCASKSHSASHCEVVTNSSAALCLHAYIKAHAECAQSMSTAARKAVKRAQSALDGLKQQRHTCRQRVNAAMDEVIAGVEARRARLLAQVDGAYNERVKSLEATLDRLSVSVGQLEACVAMKARSADVSDVSVLSGVEAACGGMSRGLCDMYLGVDVSTRLEVVADVGGVLDVLEGSVAVDVGDVCVGKCEVSGPGLHGFVNDAYQLPVDMYNVIDVKCVDGSGGALGWLTADDVHLSVKCVQNALVAPNVACWATTSDTGDGTFRVSFCASFPQDLRPLFFEYYESAFEPDSFSGDFERALTRQLELRLTVCGKRMHIGCGRHGDRGVLKVRNLYTPFNSLREQIDCENVPEVLETMEACADIADVQVLGLEALLAEGCGMLLEAGVGECERALKHTLALCAACERLPPKLVDLCVQLLHKLASCQGDVGEAEVTALALRVLCSGDSIQRVLLPLVRYYHSRQSGDGGPFVCFLWLLCIKGDNVFKTAFVSSGGDRAVMDLMARIHVTRPGVAGNAALLVCVLHGLARAVPRTVDVFVAAGVVQWILGFLDADVISSMKNVSLFIYALATMCGSQQGKQTVLASGYLLRLLALMERHVDYAPLQQAPLVLLTKLLPSCTIAQLTSVVAAGAVARILAALDAHEAVVEVQGLALEVLYQLAQGDGGALVQIRDGGGVAKVRRAMQQHPTLERHATPLLQLLGPLVDEPAAVPPVVAAAVVEAAAGDGNDDDDDDEELEDDAQ